MCILAFLVDIWIRVNTLRIHIEENEFLLSLHCPSIKRMLHVFRDMSNAKMQWRHHFSQQILLEQTHDRIWNWRSDLCQHIWNRCSFVFQSLVHIGHDRIQRVTRIMHFLWCLGWCSVESSDSLNIALKNHCLFDMQEKSGVTVRTLLLVVVVLAAIG